jgi:hypothetical protein
MNEYKLEKQSDAFIKKFNVRATKYKLNIFKKPAKKNAVDFFIHVIDKVIDKIFKNVPHNALLGFELQNDKLDRPIMTLWANRRQIDAYAVHSSIERVLQSNREVNLIDLFDISAFVVIPPSGAGRVEHTTTRGGRIAIGRKSVFAIKGTCTLAQCIAVWTLRENGQIKKLRSYKRSFNAISNDEFVKSTLQLCENAGAKGDKYSDVPKFQAILPPDVFLRVFNEKGETRPLYPDSPPQIIGKFIDVFMSKKSNACHFDLITSINGFFKAEYCQRCFKSFTNSHVCGGKCDSCMTGTGKCNFEKRMTCPDCNRYFYSESCFNNHKAQTCKRFRLCVNCKRREHKGVCLSSKCRLCRKEENDNHKFNCYMSPFIPKSDKYKNRIYIDLETMMVDGFHVTIAAAAVVCCKYCEESCMKCGGPQEKTFKGRESLRELVAFIFSHEDSLVLAHFGGKFDYHLLLHQLIKSTRAVIKPVINGMRIVSIETKGFLFLDSGQFLKMSLVNLAKQFKLQLKKQFFPYTFVTPATLNYVGKIPNISYFECSKMDDERKNDFLQ